jgi:hypothetical protein
MPSRPLAGKVAITGGVTAHLSGEWLNSTVAFAVAVIRLGRRSAWCRDCPRWSCSQGGHALLDWRAEQVEPFFSARRYFGESFDRHGAWLLGPPDVRVNTCDAHRQQANSCQPRAAHPRAGPSNHIGKEDRAAVAVIVLALAPGSERARPGFVPRFSASRSRQPSHARSPRSSRTRSPGPTRHLTCAPTAPPRR